MFIVFCLKYRTTDKLTCTPDDRIPPQSTPPNDPTLRQQTRVLTEVTQNIPPVLDENVLSVDVHVQDRGLELVLRDTCSGGEYGRLRPLTYADVHVIVLCFAVNEPETFHDLDTMVRFRFLSDNMSPG